MKKADVQILVVDDEESVRNSITTSIKRAGFSAISAANAEEAKSLAQVKTINGAIIDCMLPMVNGVDLAKDLKPKMTQDASITLMSGIFRDANFADEAKKKTGAEHFLYKPLDVHSYIRQLEERFDAKIEKPKEAIHALLANPAASNRQRQKALEQIEEMYGYDVPFLVSLFMEAQSSGHMTLYTEDDELYGITLAKGNLCSVDCPNKDDVLKELLVELGYSDDVEVSAFALKHPGEDIVEGMIAENLLSPHVREVIQRERILKELQVLTRLGNLKISFAQDRKAKVPDSSVSLERLIPTLRNLICKRIPTDFLVTFYKEWLENPFIHGEQISLMSQVEEYPEVAELKKHISDIDKDGVHYNLKSLVSKEGLSNAKLFSAIHLLSSLRIIYFGKKKNIEQEQERLEKLKTMLKELKDATPYEVFAYFGVSSSGNKSEVEKAYKEFARTNHPDRLGKEASAEEKEINSQLFPIVTAAYDILSDPEKKKNYDDEQKRIQASDQLKAENVFATAMRKMGRDKYEEALELFVETDSLHSTDDSKLGIIWAKLKINKEMDVHQLRALIQPLFGKVDQRAARKNPMFFYVRGLYNKAIGMVTEAASDFSQALDIDPNYIRARRELSTMRNSNKTMSKSTFTGDFSQIITGFFKPGKKK